MHRSPLLCRPLLRARLNEKAPCCSGATVWFPWRRTLETPRVRSLSARLPCRLHLVRGSQTYKIACLCIALNRLCKLRKRLAYETATAESEVWSFQIAVTVPKAGVSCDAIVNSMIIFEPNVAEARNIEKFLCLYAHFERIGLCFVVFVS